jgi:hypothetical protein
MFGRPDRHARFTPIAPCSLRMSQSLCVTPTAYRVEHMFDTAVESRADVLAEVAGCEREIAEIRARQVRLLRHLDRRRQMPGADELAAMLDISVASAQDLIEAAMATPELSEAMASLESGDWSFDRAAATARLIRSGAGDSVLAEAQRRDIAGVKRLAALQKQITRRSEHEAHAQRAVRCWPSLDEAMGFLHADLPAYDWRVVTAALDDRADRLPRDLAATASQRRADALVALAHDWLQGTSPAHPPLGSVVTVMVDAELAAATRGEAGAGIVNGPRVGPETLDRILCEGSVEVLVDRGSGVPLSVGPTGQVIPAKLRRFVLARDGGCVVDGCVSRYRLEVHHVVPRSRGGTNDPCNLVTLCWYHHHVAVHGTGMRLHPSGPSRRRTLLPPDDRGPPDTEP